SPGAPRTERPQRRRGLPATLFRETTAAPLRPGCTAPRYEPSSSRDEVAGAGRSSGPSALDRPQPLEAGHPVPEPSAPGLRPGGLHARGRLVNTPATHDLSVLVERLLVLPPEQWEPELASAEAS